MSANNSQFLNSIGLGNLDPGYLFLGIILLLILLIIIMTALFVKQSRDLRKLQFRLKMLTSGKDASSLEEEISGLIADTKSLKQAAVSNKKNIETLYEKLKPTYQKTGLVKYDAFQQMGGQLSFCLAMLDQENNGFIMNSVHSTEGCYCYTKAVKKGVSELSLGKEEEEALALAMESKS